MMNIKFKKEFESEYKNNILEHLIYFLSKQKA